MPEYDVTCFGADQVQIEHWTTVSAVNLIDAIMGAAEDIAGRDDVTGVLVALRAAHTVAPAGDPSLGPF